MSLYQDYLNGISTLKRLEPKNSGLTAIIIVLVLIAASTAVLLLTPWIQTAQGMGVVSTLQPENRQQAISALVPGQIQQWHVREGQRVQQGDPIVTLQDLDNDLLARLEAELTAKQQSLEAAAIALTASEQDFARQESLLGQGLVSERARDNAQIKLQQARTKVASAEAEVAQTKTRLARQSTQTKRAPQNGVITGLMSSGVATSVKAGDTLARFIPDQVVRAVVIHINGLDAPLVQPGRKVRLQFDGWPVFQFSGWPASAIGTFGGEVVFVEPVATENGSFKVWIQEDPNDSAWPIDELVRLGSKARAWILLDEVRLGYEIWRQLNNFPPNNSIVVGTAPQAAVTK